MKSKSMKVITLVLLSLVTPVGLLGQEKTTKPPQTNRPPKDPQAPKTKQQTRPLTQEELAKLSAKGRKPPKGPVFYLEPIPRAKNRFSLLLSDAEGRSANASFSSRQLSIFEAILVAASQFADTDEGVGTTGKPITTRFVDQKEPSFAVDVEKIGRTSRFYVSVEGLTGKTIADAGAIERGSKDRGKLLFMDILERVKAAVAGH